MLGEVYHRFPRLLETKFSNHDLIRSLKAIGAATSSDPNTDVSIISDAIESLTATHRTEDAFWRGLFLTTNAVGTPRTGEWLGWSLADTNGDKPECLICEVFNGIVVKICEKFKVPSNLARYFSSDLADKHTTDTTGRSARNPAVVLLDVVMMKSGETADWSHFRGTLEVEKLNINFILQAPKQLYQNARMIINNHFYRCPVLSVAIFNKSILFVVHDHSGKVSSEVFNVDEEPEKLVRIIMGFAFCSEIDLGYDASYTRKGKNAFITMDKTEYKVVRPLYYNSYIRGRGTVVNVLTAGGTKNKKFLVPNNVWVDKSRQSKEWEIIYEVEEAKIKGVVRNKYRRKVPIDEKLDTNDKVAFMGMIPFLNEKSEIINDQRWKSDKEWWDFEKLEKRDHYRILLKTLGKPLNAFRSLKELVSAFRDIFRTIGELDDHGFLHCDISLKNLLLVEEDDYIDFAVGEHTSTLSGGVGDATNDGEMGFCVGDEAGSDVAGRPEPTGRMGFRRGVIIDLDHAVHKIRDCEEISRGCQMVGTLPYMALDILSQNSEPKKGDKAEQAATEQAGKAEKDPMEKGINAQEMQANDAPIIHAYYHDLESALYVLCGICIAQAGPESRDRCSDEPFGYSRTQIGLWPAVGHNFSRVRCVKSRIVSDEVLFKAFVIGDFHEYFGVLGEYIQQLRELICPRGAVNATQMAGCKAGETLDWTICSRIERPKEELLRGIDEVLVKALADQALDEVDAKFASSQEGDKTLLPEDNRAARSEGGEG